ncbi:hypothetical protein ST47_g8888 [Ascochyta rabiei]|uniref:Uncharacterized protein n=1 Tax=Didymella rabiei TaxID=5454 RepID=A0A162YBL7_DIDRA|nr:hypothetical protein ST47_g8888 [Ascochyta rabiei]
MRTTRIVTQKTSILTIVQKRSVLCYNIDLDETVLKQTWDLFHQGRKIAPHDYTNSQALSQTPESFFSRVIELMPHQLSKTVLHYDGKKSSKAKTLKAHRNAILSTSLKAFVYPLQIDCTFDGKPVVQLQKAVRKQTGIFLKDKDSEYQDFTGYIWDKGSGEAEAGFFMMGRLLPEIQKACMKSVHTECGECEYTDFGDKYDIPPEHPDNRERLKAKAKKNWQSSRINTLIKLLQPQTLDVVSNALKAFGIDLIEFNGHMSSGKRDAAIKQFQEPSDPDSTCHLPTPTPTTTSGGPPQNFIKHPKQSKRTVVLTVPTSLQTILQTRPKRLPEFRESNPKPESNTSRNATERSVLNIRKKASRFRSTSHAQHHAITQTHRPLTPSFEVRSDELTIPETST